MPTGSRQPRWPELLVAAASILLSVNGCASKPPILNYCAPAGQPCRTSSWLAPSQKSQASSSMPTTPAGSYLPEPQRPEPPKQRAAAQTSPPVDPATGNQDVVPAAGLNHSKEGVTVISHRSEVNAEAPYPSQAARKFGGPERFSWLKTPSLTLGTRVWFSQGKLGYNFSSAGGPDVTSELLWKGQNTKIYEVKADLVVRRFVANVTLGWGSLERGTLRDSDFASNGRTGIFSDTLSSPTDGFIVYGSVDIGPRLIRWTYKGAPGALDVLVGFQYWQEKYTARGIDVDLCRSVPGFTCVLPTGASTNANAITETITWKSIRLGPRVTVPVLSRLTAVGQAFYIPWTEYKNVDIHHLRTDLPQDPSFKDFASGGQGIQLEGALQLNVWKSLRIEAGYRYWDLRSGSGTSCVGECLAVIGQLNDAKARRQGLFFGADWTF